MSASSKDRAQGGGLGPKTIRELLALTAGFFESRGIDSARLDAELLLAHALGETRLKLYMDMDRPLADVEVSSYRELVRRRSKNEPVAYLMGEKEFYSRPFKVSSAVLIPRPDTEIVVDAFLERIPKDAEGTVVDVGTGSGCIAITAALERPGLKVVATDVSSEALSVAEENARALGVSDRVELREGNLLAPCDGLSELVGLVSNPPYIRRASEGELMADVVEHEPHLALFGVEDDGLGHHRKLLEGARGLLAEGAPLVLEFGFDQAAGIRKLKLPGLSGPELFKDLSGHERGAVWVRDSETD